MGIQKTRGNTSSPNLRSFSNKITDISLIPCEENISFENTNSPFPESNSSSGNSNSHNSESASIHEHQNTTSSGPHQEDCPMRQESLGIRVYSNENDNTEYLINEDVLVFEGFALYNARIVAIREGIARAYKIHYFDWGSEYDEWVDSTCLTKINRDSLRIKANLDIGTKVSFKHREKSAHFQKPSDDNIEYQRGKMVIVYFDKLLYNGIIKSRRVLNKTLKYLIYYPGWKKQWNEWVEAYRIFECTPTTKLIKERLDFFMDKGQNGDIKPIMIDNTGISQIESVTLPKIEPMSKPTVIVHTPIDELCCICKSTKIPNSKMFSKKWINCECGKRYHQNCAAIHLFNMFKEHFTCNTISRDCKLPTNAILENHSISIEQNTVYDWLTKHSTDLQEAVFRPTTIDSSKENRMINANKIKMNFKRSLKDDNQRTKKICREASAKEISMKKCNKHSLNHFINVSEAKIDNQRRSNPSKQDKTHFNKIITEQLNATVNELHSA